MDEGKGTAATRAKNRYNQRNYEDIRITVRRGRKSVIQAAAAAAGKSVNEYVGMAILAQMGLEDWPRNEDLEEEVSVKKGDWVDTPRFLKVRIEDVLTPKEAREQGYTEPTHYEGEFDIQGKSTGINRMVFAAIKKDGGR